MNKTERLGLLFDQAFAKFVFPIQVQRSLGEEAAYMVSLHNGEGTLDGYTGETLEQALEKAIAQHSETSRLRDQVREGSRGGDEEVSKRISLIMAELESSQLTETVTAFFIDGKASVEIPQGAVILDAHITIPNMDEGR